MAHHQPRKVRRRWCVILLFLTTSSCHFSMQEMPILVPSSTSSSTNTNIHVMAFAPKRATTLSKASLSSPRFKSLTWYSANLLQMAKKASSSSSSSSSVASSNSNKSKGKQNTNHKRTIRNQNTTTTTSTTTTSPTKQIPYSKLSDTPPSLDPTLILTTQKKQQQQYAVIPFEQKYDEIHQKDRQGEKLTREYLCYYYYL